MKKYLERLKFIFVSAVILGLSSCNDFLEVDSNHAANEEQHWNTLEDARAGLMGCYGLMRAALAENNAHFLYGDLRMGDFTVYNRADLQAVADNELTRQYTMLEQLANWRRFYAVINAAAVFIEKASAIPGADRSYSDTNLAYDVAQARALRAFAYFYMVRLWGDVPLVAYAYDNGSFPLIGRTPAQQVLNYAKTELLAATADLPFVYGTSTNKYYGNEAGYWNGTLLNKLSAFALLAHIEAWQGGYADVEAYSGYVIDNASQGWASLVSTENLTSEKGLFTTGGDFAGNKTYGGSKIVGLGFRYAYREATKSGHVEDLTLAYPLIQKPSPEVYVGKEKLFSIFDNVLDQRFGVDTTTRKYRTAYVYDMNAEVPMFSKIKVVRDGSVTGDYNVFGSSLVFSRMEDMYLLHAEALVAQNRSAEAIDFYNAVRIMRGFQTSSFKQHFKSDDAMLLAAIFDERRRELMGEGWYWWDRIRREKLLGGDPEMAALIANGGIYWPISQDVLRENAMIVQNEYWK